MAQEKVIDIKKSSKEIVTPYNVIVTGTQSTSDDALAKVSYVKDQGVGLKQIHLSVPAGSPSTGYVPIIFTNVNHNEYCYISTKTSGGSDPMNNCVFDGIVRNGGWTDRGSYVTGQFNIYSENERALHSIHAGSEADNFYVAYVEVRAFPVTVKVPVGVGVATNTTVSYGTSVFVTNGQNDVGNTKGFKICDFNKGSGLYRNGNRVYDQGFKPTPSDIGTLSESAINTELNKKFDKVGGTITGLTSIEGRTTLGAYSIKRSGVTGYANFGQLAAAGTIGEVVLGIGANQESVTSYLKVGDDKLEFVSNDLPKKVFHEGQVPTLGKDLNLQWQLPSPGGTARYVRLVTLGLTDNDTTFILSGFGDNGSTKRATYNVTVATRTSGISIDINSLDVDLLSGQKPKFYHRRAGDVFEVWVKTPAFNLDATFTRMSGRGGVIRIDSTTTTEPADLTEVTVNQIYTTRFKPTPSDVGTLSESVINTELNKKFDRVGGDISGDVRFNSGNTTRLSLGSGTDYYIERSPSGLFLSSGSINPKVRVNNTNYDIYHTGNKPSATDLNVVGRYNLGTASDLRSLRNGGMYRISDTVVDGPENQNMAYGQLLHVNGAADTHMQILGNYQSSKLYWRGFNNTNLGGNWRKVYHDGDMPTPTEIGALPITGGTLTGALGITHQGIGLTIRRTTYPNIVLESTDLTDARQKYIEVSSGGGLNIITRRANGTNNGTVTINPGQDGVVYHTGNKPSPGDLGAVSSSGDTITGQIRYSAPFNGTSANAQISHIGNDAGQSLFIRNMREHNSSTLIWEKVYGGSLYYATGVNGAGASKIRMAVSQGDIYLGDANKRVYHEGFKPTAADVGTYTQAQVDAMIAKLKTDNGLK